MQHQDKKYLIWRFLSNCNIWNCK